MNKDALMIAIGKIKPKGMAGADKGPMPQEGNEHEDHNMGLESAFEELASALGVDPDKVDAKAGSEALKNFLTQCHGSEESEPDGDEEGSDEESSY